MGGNFSARLMQNVRDKEGLTYHISSSVAGVENLQDGFWHVRGSFAPTLIEKGTKSTMSQLEKWFKEGITEEELAAKKSTIIGSYKVGMANSKSLANLILANAERGRSTAYLDEYPKLVEALTLQQVNNVINHYVNINNLITVNAGSL